jgi:hypothetical protein
VSWATGNLLLLGSEHDRFNSLLFALYSNIAACYLKLEKFPAVLKYCQRGLDLPKETQAGENVTKIYYR